MAKKRPSLAAVMRTPEDITTTPEPPTPEAKAIGETRKGRQPDPESKRNKWVQLNVFVPEELRDSLKLKSIRQKRDMSDIVVEALEQLLSR